MKLFTPVLFSLLWLFSAATLAFPCSRDNVSSAECQALIDFYDDTHGDDWQQNDNWLSGDVNQWYGVELRDDQVISLNLPENNLVGTQLRDSFCDLTQLEVLNLHQNQIQGSIPTCLDKFTSLKHLVLANNQFTDTIPESLCALTQLESLRLMGNQLSGSIPTCLGNLTQLDTLWLHGNQLTGTIPVELCQLNQLESLGLARNQFSGALPACIGDDLGNLQVLYLSHNEFVGQIPASFSNLTALKQFYLDHNKFSGPLPAEFVSMALNNEDLVQLHISRNYFKFDDCQSVQQLILRGGWEESVLGWPDGGFIHSPQINTVSNFETQCPPLSPTLIVKKVGSGVVSGPNIDCGNTCTGTYLPNEEVTLTATADAGFEFTLWSGDCYGIEPTTTVTMDAHNSCVAHFTEPAVLICDDVVDEECQALVDFFQKTGGPEWVAEKKAGWLQSSAVGGHWAGVTVEDGHVTELKLAAGNLSGVIPEEVCQFTQLQYLDLGTHPYGNQLIGEIPTCLGDLIELEVLSLERNNLEGIIPPELGNLTNLTTLNLRDNPFDEGTTLPESLCDLTKLEVLNLGYYRGSRSGLTGSIPNCIGDDLLKLNTLRLHYSKFTGEIPPSLCNLTNLRHLHLGYNHLTGEIPSCFDNLSNLISLNLFLNQLTGEIPSQLGNLAHLQSIGLDRNKLIGPIPTEICNLAQLESLRLYGNQLTGEIPSCLGNLTNLRYSLYLQSNQLTGSIPSEICNLTNLTALYLGNNPLSGEIPSCIGNLSNLQRLYLRHSNLTGRIPDSFAHLTQLQMAALDNNQLQGPLSDELINGILNNPKLVNFNLSKNNFGLNECQAIHKLRVRGGWVPYIPGWGTWADNGLEHSPQNDNFDFSVDCASLNFYILNVTKIGSGTVTSTDNIITCGDHCIEAYDANTEITLTATPQSGARFITWSGDCSGSDPTTTITLDADTTCTAEFEPIPICDQVTDIPQSECLALVALYNNTNGNNWNQQQGWLSEPQAADWHGVTVFNQHVVGLQLSTNNLDGSLPTELCDLTQLAHLSMGLNLLNGALPGCLGNLSQLQLLYLSQNAFLNGTLPASLSQLTQLKQLYLDGNEFQGPLPSAFVDMALNSTALVQFNFFKNNFGAEDCQAVNALIDRGGWIETLPGWEDVSNGFMHSTQNDGFNFEQDCAAATNELMITKVGNGTVSGDGIDCGTTCVQTYEPNTPVTLTASAAIDHLFSHWSNSCADQTDNPLTIIMDADKICTAHFELKPASFCSQVTDITQAQCEVLEALYYNNGGNTWNDNTGWLTDTTVNNWSGVTVSAGQVSKLELVDNNLIGSLSPALCELQQLQVIKLDDNPNLTGSLPGCIGSILSQLEILSIANSLTEDNDGLNGGIPASLCQLTALKTLRLQGNQFSGAIPNCFDTLTQLTELGLHHNQLSGNLPDTLCELTQLTHLGLGHNQLNGTLPTCIGDKPLLQLELLYLSDNQFSGAVPESFRNLINLKQLYLDQNQFDSPIADTLGQMLLASPHLIQLNLQQNNLGAEDCTLITALMDKDGWVETLPGWENIGQGFQHSPQNNDFDFTQDCVTTPPPTTYSLTLTKTGAGSITSDDDILNCGSTCQQNYAENTPVVLIAHADAGATFSHWGDDCSGETPEATVIMNEAKTCSAHFEAVAPPPPPPPVFTCNAITDIPQAECAALSNFYAQTDGDNWNEHSGWLTETTAAQWQGITVTDGHVSALELAENNLSGTVPAALGDLIELTTLNLAQNTLQGNLPAAFCQLIQLTQLTLNDNQLNGSIPTCIGGGFLNLQQLNLANNQLSGTIPQALSNLNSLQQLYLGNNELTGPLTEAFTNLTQLTHLTLNSNHFGVDSCGAVHQLMERDPPWALLLHSPQKDGFDFQNDCVFVSLNTLSVASEGPGKIVGDGIDCGTDCVQTFDTGAIEVNLEAIHQDDAIFLNWTGDCTGTEPKIEVIMNDDKTCTAHFQQQDVPPPLETTTINLTKTGSGRGTVRGKLKGSKTWSLNCLTECTETNHEYNAQSEITLTAKPLKGFEFKGWGQDCPGDATQITLTLDAPNKNCTAEFIPDANARQLTVESAGPGTITAPWLNCSDNCVTYYRHERKVRLTATPDDNALFLGWQGDCQGLSNRFTVTMDADKTCTAQFQTHNPDETLTLTVNKSGNGRGTLRVIAKNDDTPFLCRPDCLNAHQDYTSGEQLTLVAKPMEHFIFTHWEGDCSGTDPRIKLIMNESKDCTAYFNLDPNAVMHTLTLHIIGTGSGQVNARQWSGNSETCQLGCTIYYPAEEKFRLKAHQAPFSTFAGWSGDCSGQGKATLVEMTEDKTCSANFQSDFEVISNNIIDIFYKEAQLQDGDLTTHYPRSANETCLRETFWLSTLALMHADQHRQISQTWPEQFNDIEWYTPLAADYCTRSIKTMSGEYIDIEVKLKTQANSEELAHVIIHYLEEQPNVDERPVIFFERSTFTQW